jgi:hypothetical protein
MTKPNNALFIAHGSTIPDYVIIPKGVDWFLPITNHGKKMFIKDIEKNHDILQTAESRSYINDDTFDDQKYAPGHVINNAQLIFNCTWSDEIGYTTGIITTKPLHRELIEIHKMTDEKIMKELMYPHDESIVKKSDLWNKKMELGELLRLIASKTKNIKIFGLYCRDIPEGCSLNVPKFLSVKMTSEIYHSDFYLKLDTLIECANQRDFPGYEIYNLEYSKLKMRITVTKLCELIHKKLKTDNTISSLEFHSVIEIYHAKKFPFDCVVFAIEAKLDELCFGLYSTDPQKLIFDSISNPTPKKFLAGLLNICVKFLKNVEDAIVKYQENKIFDNVIFTAENVINGSIIKKCFYDAIIKYADTIA